MDCEICGRSDDTLTLVSLRGTQMFVCFNCKKYGMDVPKKVIPAVPKTKTTPTVDKEEGEEYELVNNYTRLIQMARNQKDLSQKDLGMKINESESLVSKIEAGKIKPTEKIIRKLERFFSIKIYGKVE